MRQEDDASDKISERNHEITALHVALVTPLSDLLSQQKRLCLALSHPPDHSRF
jgi:hypothetical protein